MASISKGKTFSTNETVSNTKLHQLVDSATISGIVAADISDGVITEAKLDINNSPTDDYVLTWDATSGKPQWEENDTAGMTKSISQNSHGLSVGNWVKYASGAFAKAQADSAANAEVVGVVSAVAGTDDFTLQVGGHITGLTGLTENSVHFLDPSTAGAITTTEPSTIGQISKPCLIADGTTSGYIIQMRGLDITDQAQNKVLQVVNTQSGAYQTGTSGNVPDDNTIPTWAESLKITGLDRTFTGNSTDNVMRIDVVVNFSASNTLRKIVMLFEDGSGTDECIACQQIGSSSSGNMSQCCFTFFQNVPDTSEHTYSVGIGTVANTETIYINSTGGAARWGGVSVSSITITEFQA